MNKLELYDIPNFTGYKITKDGRVFSCLKQGCRDRYDSTKYIEPYELKARPTKNGYLRVYMRSDLTNRREEQYVHRLVAKIFIPNFSSLPEANHKDSNRTNNNYQNLEWVSRIDNLAHAQKHGYATRDQKGRFCHK